ncbi:phosphoribosylformylglycinamidine synthase [Candidatus Roizmanbacteria bacterium]|nr:phosphoribosylformylglycinamidine synthase [Candidatus Roizmanbacteria bacterium]
MAIQEIHVGLKEGRDPRGEAVIHDLQHALGITTIVEVVTTDVYRYEGISSDDAEKLRAEVLTDPVIEQSSGGTRPFEPRYGITIEIGKRPGVMDPDQDEMIRAANYLGVNPIAAARSTIYTFTGSLTPQQIEAIHNHMPSQVEQVIDTPPASLKLDTPAPVFEMVEILDLSPTQLLELSTTRRLFLNLQEMQVIQDYFKRQGYPPTDVELETLAQTWSEHNGHKTFKAKLFTPEGIEKRPLISRIRETSEKHYARVGVVSAFEDNSGVLRADDEDDIEIKAETHNSPVAIEPFGGAATKNGGVYRDITGTGRIGKNLVSLMVNCFAPPDLDRSLLPKGSLDPLYLLKENSRGERDYGNKIGIPTHGTNLHFHPDFRAKPTSMGIAVGVIPHNRARKGTPEPGNMILTIGGRTGRDGIHGATFSSGEMTADTKRVDGTAVQIGNPIEQHGVFSALEACGDEGLIQATTDCGGGGYSSAIGEIGEPTGVAVHLDRVPLKYEGLAPWEIWLSESQERMIAVAKEEDVAQIQEICKIYGAPVDAIGECTGDKRLTIMNNGVKVADLPMDFLHDGLPQREMHMVYKAREEKSELSDEPDDWQDSMQRVLSHLNVCSKEPMLRQYDQTVKGITALEPFTGVHRDMPNDASVVRLRHGKKTGVVTAHGVNPVLNAEDPYWGSKWAVVRAINNFVAHGGNPNRAALIDNFVWPFPDEESLGDLDRSVDALCESMDAYELPCISGKDSLSSTYRGPDGKVIKIPPVLNITVVGPVEDVAKTTSADIKKTGSVICYVGSMKTDQIGGSIYAETHAVSNSHIPQVDLETQRIMANAIYDATKSDNMLSCKSIGEGGMAAALSLMCFGGDCGADITLDGIDSENPHLAFFNETPGFLVEVSSVEEAEELFGQVPHAILGTTTTEKRLSIRTQQEEKTSIDLSALKQAWKQPMKELLS